MKSLRETTRSLDPDGAFERVNVSQEEHERQVQQRTQELNDINVALRNEVEERTRIETALRASEDRMRRAITIETVGVIFFNAEGVITDTNDAFLKMSGYDRDDFTKGHIRWDDLTPPEFRSASMKAIHEVLTKGETTPYEKQYIRKDGSRWWGLFAARRLSENDNVKFVLDITERKRAEEVLAADLKDTRLLNDLGTRLVREGDIQVLYDEIIAAAVELTRADAGTMQILDENSGDLLWLTTKGFDQRLSERLARVHSKSSSIYARALITGERAFIDFDTTETADIDGSLKMHIDAGYLSAQSTPLTTRTGRRIGVLSTLWRSHHRPSERELRFLDLLMRQAADLIERKQIDDALRQSEGKMAAELADTRQLQHLSSRLIHEDDTNALYDQILDAAKAVMHSDMASLQVLDPVRNELRLLGHKGFHPASAVFWQWVSPTSGSSCASALHEAKREILRDIELCDYVQKTEDLEFYRLSGIRGVQSTPLLSRNGHLVGMISTHWKEPHEPAERELQLLDVIARQAADLIERRKAQESLRESEERFRAIISQTVVGIEHADLNGKIKFANHKLAEMLGYSDGELAGMSARDVTYADDVDEHMKRLERLAATGMPFQIDKRLIRKDGSKFWSSVSVSALRDANGQPESAIAVVIDITERKRAEAEREIILGREQAARAEAEEANRLKDEFLATVSHELRSPLNSIFGWVRLLQSASLNDAETRRALDTIERGARSQAQLIEDLLEVSRIITGKMRLNIRQVDLATTVTSAIDSIRPTAQAKGVRIESRIDPSAGPVSGDDERLQQVVWNLLSNAVKFTPEGGVVSVILRRINSHVEIVVTDTGQGISLEFLPHVFERFKQASAGSVRKYGGLGLGLAIVRHLVELHGGAVFAESQGEGEGATFRVRLPMMQRRGAHVDSDLHFAVQPELQIALNGVSVLVVDNDMEARLLLRAIIEKGGATVYTAGCAEEARELLGRENIDVIISDIEMPDEDGYSFIRSVRVIDKLKKIPAVALTAYARSQDRKRTLLEGFQFHLSKPVEPAELMAVIKSLAGIPRHA